MRAFRILLPVVFCFLGSLSFSQSRSLLAERRGEWVHLAAPQPGFLRGKALEKLHNGSTVAFVLALTAIEEHTKKSIFAVRERFEVSFDLWEEKYTVVQRRHAGRSASHLAAAMAESWCLESMPVPVRTLPEQQPFMIKLVCSIDENESETGGKGNSTLTLSGLIDIFSRRSSEVPLQWDAVAGPFRLIDLKSAQ
jgi:hypothetical protein